MAQTANQPAIGSGGIANGPVADSFQLGNKTVNLRASQNIFHADLARVRERMQTLYATNSTFRQMVDSIGFDQIDVTLTNKPNETFFGRALPGSNQIELNLGTFPPANSSYADELDKTTIQELGHLNEVAARPADRRAWCSRLKRNATKTEKPLWFPIRNNGAEHSQHISRFTKSNISCRLVIQS